MYLPFFVKAFLISHHHHLHITKPDVPYIKIVINLLLQLSAQPEPHCKRSPKVFMIDHYFKEMQEVVDVGVFRQHLHTQSFLVHQSSVEIHHFLARLVDDQLQHLRIRHQDIALMGCHFEKGDLKPMVFLSVDTFFFGEREALGWSKMHPSCCRQFQELE